MSGWSNQEIALLVLSAGLIGFSGLFAYSPTPGAGNLIFSLSASAGHDPFGNLYPVGVTLYQSTPLQFANLSQPFSTNPTVTASQNAGSAQLVLSSGADSTNTTGVLVLVDSGNAQGASAQITSPARMVVAGESWHAVTLPPGMTGTIRVKQLAEGKFAALDVNVNITSSLTTPSTFTGGSLPTAVPSYYPLASRQFPLSVNGQFTATSNASPRVIIPTSGAMSMPMPGFASAGVAVIVSGLIVYPLD